MWSVNNIDFSRLTQILYFSLTPNTNGSLNIPSAAISNIGTIKTAIGTNDVDILISIGGWGKSDNFPAMSSTSEKRSTFINELKDFCINNGLKGADIDWEFPSGATELANCTFLLKEMQIVFHENNLIVTSAQRPNAADLEDEALNYLDQIHIMSYDNGSYHSTYNQAVSAVNHFIERGASRSKLLLGVPFYGRKISGGAESSYRNIYNTYSPSTDTDEAGGYYYNGVSTISKKTQYSMDQGLKGIMIWDISMDTNDDSSSLLKAIYDTKKN